MYDGEPETPVSGEERVIDCGAMGVVRWEVSQSMWDHLSSLSDADRERVLDITAHELHGLCHGVCAYVARFVERKAQESVGTADEFEAKDTFPESWLHE